MPIEIDEVDQPFVVNITEIDKEVDHSYRDLETQELTRTLTISVWEFKLDKSTKNC